MKWLILVRFLMIQYGPVTHGSLIANGIIMFHRVLLLHLKIATLTLLLIFSSAGNQAWATSQSKLCRLILAGKNLEVHQELLLHEALSQITLGKSIGIGGQFEVFEIEVMPSMVIKRLRDLPQLHLQENRTRRQYFAMLKEQHRLIESYFGPEFVPTTYFFEVPFHIKISDVRRGQSDNVAPSPSLPEFIMVQRRLEGEEEHFWDPSERIAVTTQLKAKLLGFVQRYRTMQKDGLTIEDQIMIDFSKNKVWISDTNFPRKFSPERFKDKLFEPFMKAFNIDVNSLKTPTDVWNVLVETVPEFQAFKGIAFDKIAHLLQPTYGDKALFKRIRQRYELSGNADLYTGVVQLIFVLDDFPPRGDNRFIRNLIYKYGL